MLDRRKCTHDRRHALHRAVVLQAVGNLGAGLEVAAQQLRDHQALANFGIGRIEIQSLLVKRDGGRIILVDIRGAGSQKCA